MKQLIPPAGDTDRTVIDNAHTYGERVPYPKGRLIRIKRAVTRSRTTHATRKRAIKR